MGTIIGHANVPVADLVLLANNPRHGDVGAISQSLEAHGQYRPIVVNKPTMEILAGNHTYKAAVALGWKKIAVNYVDVNAEEAQRIMLADNRTNDLATYDNAVLADILGGLAETPDKFTGIGFDERDLNALLKDISSPLEFPDVNPDDTLEVSCPRCGFEFNAK